MPPSERSPLLSSQYEREDEHEHETSSTSEAAPLLSEIHRRSSSSRNARDRNSDKRRRAAGRRWPSLIAISSLAVLVVAVMTLGFVAPPAVKLYAESAAVIEPTGLSVEALTPGGVRARIQANFRLDGSRVSDDKARFLGRLATGVVRKLDTEEMTVQIHLPGYDNTLLGSVVIPPLAISLVDGHNTAMDFVTELSVGDANIMRELANAWLNGELEQIKVTGSAAIHVRSGIFSFGTHRIVESMVFEAKDIPTMPAFEIGQINIRDVPVGGGQVVIGANASLTVHNEYPVGLAIPPLGFDILVPNCEASEAPIHAATATTASIVVEPFVDVAVDAVGLIRDIPEPLIRPCPNSDMSPFDKFMKQYLHGGDARVFVQGRESDNGGVPGWVGSIVNAIVVPVDLPGRSLDDAIRNISVTDIDFKLPSPFADPSSPNGKPRVSGTLQVFAALPSELQLDVDVDSLMAESNVLYRGRKFGELNLRKWQKAASERLDDGLMKITARVVNVPLDITDADVFSEVAQQLLFGDKDLILDIDSLVDAKVSTSIGGLVLKEIPAQGKMPIKHLPGTSFAELDLHVRDIVVVETSRTSLRMRASVDVTNPTPYTASIPYASVQVLTEGRLVGELVCRDMDFKLGSNKGVMVYATWDPVSLAGEEGHEAARRLLSDYLSGKNTTLTLRTHRSSIPAAPAIGEALSHLNITLPTPRVRLPGGDGDDGDGDDNEDGQTHFVRDATFHLLSSTASFHLASPLRLNTVSIERVNATAFYNHTEPVGVILYDEAIDALPGITETPRLPVEWSLESIGLDKIRDALGGSLRLDAVAEARLRIGNWVETVEYRGAGIGAKIRL